MVQHGGDKNLRPIVTIMVSFDSGVDIVNDITLTIPEHGMHIEVKVKCIDRMSQLVHARDYFISRDKNCLPNFIQESSRSMIIFKASRPSNMTKCTERASSSCLVQYRLTQQLNTGLRTRKAHESFTWTCVQFRKTLTWKKKN
jgi:hypothetical protein